MRFPFHSCLALLLATTAVRLAASVDLLLVPPPEGAAAEARPVLTLHLNNPTEFDAAFRFESEIEGEYADASGHRRIHFTLIDESQRRVDVPRRTRVVVRLRPEEDIRPGRGFISLRLLSPRTNPVMFPAAPTPPVAAAQPPVATRGLRRPNLDLTSDVEEMRRHISGHEPIYFAVGTRDRLNARFQFSFKYRVLDPGPDESELGPVTNALGMLYFAYTQTSIWDLDGFSRPFYDSSYRPALFLQHALPRIPGSEWNFALRGGAQHESNGKGGGAIVTPTGPGLVATNRLRHPSDSRSLNTLFAAATARWEDVGARFIEVSLQANAYFHIDENPDIAAYRGHAEIRLRGGYARGLQLSAHLRGRPDHHGSVEFNLTWPTSESPLLRGLPFIGSLGGYAQIQYFNGYGESLLDYDVRRRDQLRLGLMIVR